MTCTTELTHNGWCEIYGGVVIAVGQLPRTHVATTTHRDRHGHTHTDVHVSQYIERELWIASPGAPDRRFIVGEWFGALPGHEVILACAPGCAQPFRLHNLSTGQLADFFQPEPFDPIEFLAACVFGAALLAVPVWIAVVAAWYDLRPAWSDPPWGPLTATIYGVALVVVLLLATPHAGTKAARRQWARRVVDTRLAAFEVGRQRRTQKLINAQPHPVEGELWE